MKRTLWNLYATAKAARQRPSDLLSIGPWAAELIGMPYDTWTPYQFDSAVTLLGGLIDSKLYERDKKGHPVHKLETLLDDEVHGGGLSAALAAFGAKVRIAKT